MDINLKKLETEMINENTHNIDKVSTVEMIRMINEEDKKVAYYVEEKIEVISNAVDIIANAIINGGRLVYIGAGTSGRLGVLDASECPPTYGVDHNLVVGIMAGGKSAMFKAKEGAEDDLNLAETDLKEINFNEKDVLVGIAASGRTPYVIGGLQYANSLNAQTISLCCVSNGEISKYANTQIEVPVFGEVVTGSTRMKAGTAQKTILNMLSTGAMIKTGKIYGNLMVNVKPSNKKLVKRAISIINECTNVGMDICEKVFLEADNDVTLSIFMIKTELSKEEAREYLNKHNGVLSKALSEISC